MAARRNERPTIAPGFDVQKFARESDERIRTAERSSTFGRGEARDSDPEASSPRETPVFPAPEGDRESDVPNHSERRLTRHPRSSATDVFDPARPRPPQEDAGVTTPSALGPYHDGTTLPPSAFVHPATIRPEPPPHDPPLPSKPPPHDPPLPSEPTRDAILPREPIAHHPAAPPAPMPGRVTLPLPAMVAPALEPRSAPALEPRSTPMPSNAAAASPAPGREAALPILGVPTVAIDDAALKRLPLDHRTGFVLSLMDGATEIETILELSAMDRDEAVDVVHGLLEAGIIRFS